MTRQHHSIAATLTVTGLATILIACPVTRFRPNSDHCTNNEGDAYCAEVSPDTPRCTIGFDECSLGGSYGCVVEAAEECYQPCGTKSPDECGEMSESSSGSSGSETGESTESETETGSSGTTTGEEPCMGDDECMDTATPFCDPAGECVSCDGLADGDAACAEQDPGLPLCVAEACVACTESESGACSGTTPVCDDASNTCVACTEHGQCGDAACNLFSGACLPAEAVVRVGPMRTFATLTEAVASFAVDTEGTIIVHQGAYDEGVTVDGGRTIAFLVNEGDLPSWDGPDVGDAPQLTVLDGTVLMDGIQMSGNGSSADPGLVVDGGRAWVDRGRIVQNTGGGVLASNGAELVLRNSFVGQAVSEVVGVEVDDASAAILYSTITASTFGTIPAVGCVSPISVDIRNSIIVTQGGTSPDELSCATATVTNTSTEADLPMFDVGWFEDFNGGDYGLTVSGAPLFENIAQWQDGDPPTDIDDDPRPAVDGTPDYAGADVPQ